MFTESSALMKIPAPIAMSTVFFSKKDLTGVMRSFIKHLVWKTDTSWIYRIEKIHTELLNRASEIIDEIIRSEEIFEEINKEDLLSDISKVIGRSIAEGTVEKLNITRETIKKIIALKLVSGMLSELSDEEIENFERTVSKKFHN